MGKFTIISDYFSQKFQRFSRGGFESNRHESTNFFSTLRTVDGLQKMLVIFLRILVHCVMPHSNKQNPRNFHFDTLKLRFNNLWKIF